MTRKEGKVEMVLCFELKVADCGIQQVSCCSLRDVRTARSALAAFMLMSSKAWSREIHPRAYTLQTPATRFKVEVIRRA